MNILVLNYEFPPLGGGASPVSRDISIQLKNRGHEVTVLTMGFQALADYEEIQGVKVHRLKCLRTQKNVCKPWEQFTYLLAVRSFMKNHMKTQHYDVCHTHFIIPTGEAARWIHKKYHIPYVITAHGSDVEGHNKKISMKIMHRMLRNSWRKIVNDSAGVVAPSKYLQNLMNSNYAWNKYTYIPNGINYERYRELAAPEWKEERILVMGRLQAFKGVQLILRALARVDLRGWEVDILGDGPYREELEQLSDKLKLTEKVHFHGWIDYGTEEQLKYLRKASIYVSASQFENCPMSVIEAAAAGCYPLLSDILAHRQLISEDEYYFDVDDVGTLAEKINKCISRGVNGLSMDIDVSKFDWEQVIPQYEEILENTCHNA